MISSTSMNNDNFPDQGKMANRPGRHETVPTPAPSWTGSLSGMAGAVVALSIGEVVEGASNTIPSLVVAVGELIADYTPGDVVAVSIANLGTSQKSVLIVSIVAASLLIGGALGRFAVRDRQRLTITGFAVFGLIGGWATARNPFSPALGSWVMALCAAAMGTIVTLALTNRAQAIFGQPRSRPAPTTPVTQPMPFSGPMAATEPTATLEPTTRIEPAASIEPTTATEPTTKIETVPVVTDRWAERRAFLAWVGGAGAAALALVGIGRSMRGPSAAEIARESSASAINPTARDSSASAVNPTASETGAETVAETVTETVAETVTETVTETVAGLDNLDEIDGIATYITPNNSFYRIDTALSIPQVDPANWGLRFTGMVDSPYKITYDEILSMDLSEYVITLSCVSNRVGGDLVGNAMWTGVPLAGLLDQAGVQPGATQVVGRSVDDWTAGFPTEVVYDGRNAILAVGMNGEPLPIRHGFPARLVVAGLYGYVSAVKWIEEIHLTTWDAFDAYWVPRGWSKEGPMKTQSRIDTPNGGQKLIVGSDVAVAGVAWAPTRGIAKVEVRIDEQEWQTCELGEALGDESWVQWVHEWTPTREGDYRIQVRATDGDGQTQSPEPVPPRPNGAEGWHTIRVNVSA